MDRIDKKIMISAPVRNRYEILDHYLNSIKNIDYDKSQIDLYWIINNSSNKVMDILNKFIDENKSDYNSIGYDVFDFNEVCAINADRSGINRELFYKNVAVLRNKIIERAKSNSSDYLLFWDTDILAPKNILKELLCKNKDCIAGLVKNHPMMDAYNFLHYSKERDMFVRKHDFNFNSKNLIKVDLTGALILLSKKAIESGKYYSCKSGEDEGFARCMMENQIDMWIAPELRCQHIYDIRLFLERGITI